MPPAGTVVYGVNTSTGDMDAPAVLDAREIEVKVICPSMAGAFKPVERAVSALDDILKPAVVAA